MPGCVTASHQGVAAHVILLCVSMVTAVVVVQNATVLDLKKAIQRYMQLKQEREGGVQHISW